MPEIAFINETGDPALDVEIAFAAAAIDAQMREDICPNWPSIPYQPVNFYASKKDLPVASGLSIIFAVCDKLDTPGMAAYHSYGGVPFVKIDRNLGVLSVLASHEAAEESCNPSCTKTFYMPDGQLAAWEISDAVQGWTYLKKATVLGEARDVEVSAFLLPVWFYDEIGSTYFCPGVSVELLPKSIAPGGYVPVLRGKVWDAVFGSQVTPGQQEAKRAVWASNPTNRASRRISLL